MLPSAPRGNTVLAHLLRRFSKVHPDEALTVVLMTACAFALLTCATRCS